MWQMRMTNVISKSGYKKGDFLKVRSVLCIKPEATGCPGTHRQYIAFSASFLSFLPSLPQALQPSHYRPGGDRQGCSYHTGPPKWPVLSHNSSAIALSGSTGFTVQDQVDSTTQAPRQVSVCRQCLVLLIAWPPCKLSGHLPWKGRVRD